MRFSIVTIVFLYLCWLCQWVIFSFERYDWGGKAKTIRIMLLITGNLVAQVDNVLTSTYMPRLQFGNGVDDFGYEIQIKSINGNYQCTCKDDHSFI